MTEREPRHVIIQRGEPPMRIELPDGIGHVEIRTDGVNPPTGYPTISVEVISKTKNTPAKDGRQYQPRFDHDCGVVLVGRPGPKLAEDLRVAAVMEAHLAGNHNTCPSTCPVVQATQGR